MDEKTAAVIEKLAEKFGTTADHLWGVLIRQAPISGTVDLVFCTVLVLASAYAIVYANRKTSSMDKYDDGRVVLPAIAGMLALLTLIITSSVAESIVSAFANPEYWALHKILSKL